MDARHYATEIVKKLVAHGHTAYFAGGWVRDYLMGHPSSDIDIATDAPPEKILDLFPHTILVGLAFGVVIVVIQGHQFEVSTFRKDIEYLNGRTPEKIELSTPEEDAKRRDFTINGMFYDPLADEIHDFVHGLEDIKRGIIRTIGIPQERFMEDRLRMIRAIRFSSRFGFPIEQKTQEGIIENADTLFPAVAMERVWQEFCKMALGPNFDHALIELHRLGLLPVIFPSLKHVHLRDIKEHVKAIPRFPKKTPPVASLLELFPFASLEEIQETLITLRCSNQELKLSEFMLNAKAFLNRVEKIKVSDVELAHYYAHPDSELGLNVFAAHLQSPEDLVFLKKHKLIKERLKAHVERISLKKPLITGAMLKEMGVVPGVQMGKLLKEAEGLAITHDLHHEQSILKLLVQSQHWPKKG